MASGFKFSLYIEPSLATLAEMYSEIADKLTDLRGVWEQFAPEIAAAQSAHISNQKSAEARPWAPLSRAYKARKIAKGYDSRILVRTGSLFERLLGAKITKIGKTFVRIGIDITDYEAIMQYGAPKKNFVARPFMGLDQRLKAKIVDAIREHIDSTLEEVGSSFTRAGGGPSGISVA